MKKTILYFIVFILYTNNSSAQMDTFTDVFENGSTPIWAHVALDTSAIGVGKRTGVNGYFGIVENKILIQNHSAYIMYWNIFDEISGSFLEKVDLRNGKTVWTNYFDLRNTSKREITNRFFINSANELEVIGMRNPLDSVFLIWLNGKLSVRKYDTTSGRLIYSHFAPERDSAYRTMYCNLNAVVLVKNNNHGYDYYYNYYEKRGFASKKTTLDSLGKFISEDTVFIPSQYPSVYTFSNTPNLVNDDPDRLIAMRFSLSTYPYISGDPIELKLDLYNRDQVVKQSIDISSHVPKVKNYYRFYSDDKVFIMVSEEGFDNTNAIRQGLHLFDWNGNLLEKVVYQSLSNEPFGKINKVIKLKNEPGMLILNRAPTSLGSIMTFYKTDGKGNMSLVKDLKLKEDYISIGNNLTQLNDGNILLNASYHRQNNPDFYATDRCITSLWSAEELGLVTSTKEEVDVKSAISIYPNPADNEIHIQGLDNNNIYVQIFQPSGELVMNNKLSASEANNLKIDHLQNGIYFLQLLNDKKKLIYSTNFVKQSKLD